jgi:hypothetical protein
MMRTNRTVVEWEEDYLEQLLRQAEIVREYERRQAERDAIRPAWAFTLFFLGVAVACYVAKYLELVSTPRW